MEISERLSLPYILPAQAQKHVTHNEAIRELDVVVQLSVLSSDELTPPTTPQPGDSWIIGDGAVNDWAGKDKCIATYQDGAFVYHEPKNGWRCYDIASGKLLAFDGAGWVNVAEQVEGFSNLNLLGVNANADNTNRLAVSSPATLFSHEGDDHRMVVNKAQTGDTASLLFQSNWQGKAEAGLTGDDTFRIKVTDDGSTWHEGMAIDPASGKADFPNGAEFPTGTFTLAADNYSNGAYQSVTGINQQFARYTLVGNLCFCRCAFTPIVTTEADLTAGSSLKFSGLPFLVKNLAGPVDQAAFGSAYRSIGSGLNTLLGGYCSYQSSLFIFAFALATNNAKNTDLHVLNFSYEIN